MFLTGEERFMPEMHLKEPGFTYSACGPFTKNKGSTTNELGFYYVWLIFLVNMFGLFR